MVVESYSQNEYGVLDKTTTKHPVYVNVTSVTSQEWFEGGRNGLNPAFRMTMFAPDYQGETMLEYNGATYSIYRTYKKRTDEIELHVERKGGSNGR